MGTCSNYGEDYTGHCPTSYSHCYAFSCICSLTRTGRFCGQCEEGYSVAINSHYLECVLCSEPGKVAQGWAALIGLEFIPVTVMIGVIMLTYSFVRF